MKKTLQNVECKILNVLSDLLSTFMMKAAISNRIGIKCLRTSKKAVENKRDSKILFK
jgi:hypothetical protein